MITLLSPAKTLDFDSRYDHIDVREPFFVDESEKLINNLRRKSTKKIGELMNLSRDLAELNADRYQSWNTVFSHENSRPALMAFGGDVYRGMDNKSLTMEDLLFADRHVRILSGLHGVLKAMDHIQPYRLEMGTSLKVGRANNLYQFWGDKITDAINAQLEDSGSSVLINLASTEYSKAVDFSKINGTVITPVFKDFKNGEYKVVMTWSKLARGMMAGYIIRHRINDPEKLKGFEEYQYNDRLSEGDEWVFTRE